MSEINAKLAPAKIALPDGSRVEVDALGEGPDGPVVAEIWAHQGPLVGSQPKKVLTDALKLLYLEAATGISYRKILCFTDEVARRPFRGKSWGAGALRHFNVEAILVDISPELREKIVAAQKSQHR